MPFDGNGVYNPIDPPDFPAVAGTTILASQYNNEINDLAAALSNCWTLDGQSTNVSHQDMNFYRLMNVADPAAAGDAMNRDYVRTHYVGGTFIHGMVASTNATTTFSLSGFTQLMLTDGLEMRRSMNGGAVACNIATSGPTPGGRDQAGAFAINSWVYIWYIGQLSGGAMFGNLLASASAVNPTMPSGYTYRHLIAAVRVEASGNLLPAYYRGSKVYWNTNNDADIRVLTAGAATSMTAVSCATRVPPGAMDMYLNFIYSCSWSVATTGAHCYVRPGGSTSNGYSVLRSTVANSIVETDNWVWLPNTNGNFEYRTGGASGGVAAQGVYVDVLGFSFPNGDC